MAKLVQVIPALASTLGMTAGAVEAYVKPLRKARLISSGPRGPGAPEMGTRDVTHVLLAVLAGSPTSAVSDVLVCSDLSLDTAASAPDDSVERAFGGAHPSNLVEAVEALLAMHVDGRARAVLSQSPYRMVDGNWEASIRLELEQPRLFARLQVFVPSSDNGSTPLDFGFYGARFPVPQGDLVVSRRVTGSVFAALGALLAQPSTKIRGEAP